MRRSTMIDLTANRAAAASLAAQKHRLTLADAVAQDAAYKDLPGVAFHAKSPAFQGLAAQSDPP